MIQDCERLLARPTVLCSSAVGLVLSLTACDSEASEERPVAIPSNTEERIARAASLELEGDYVGPPGDALVHHTAVHGTQGPARTGRETGEVIDWAPTIGNARTPPQKKRLH